jgi:hypothetical protein
MSRSEREPLMGSGLMFLDCPAYLDRDGGQRCGLPAEVKCRFIMESTDGPLDSAMIRCPAGHWFTGAIESLTLTTGPGGTAAMMTGWARTGIPPGTALPTALYPGTGP